MRIEKVFKPEQFTATKWETAEDKAAWANRFVAFCNSGFHPSLFTKSFYNRLSNTFGHIAHYSRWGFFNTFFTDDTGIGEFFNVTMQYPCYGSPEFTYSDVEKVLQEYYHVRGRINACIRAAHSTAEDRRIFAGSHE